MRAWARQRPRVVWSVVLAFGLVAVLALGSGLWLLLSLRDGLPDGAAIGRIGDMDQATIVLDQNDQPVFTVYKEHRIEIPLGEVSPHLVRAIVAIEDQRFYQHQGFDLIRMAAAAFADIRHGSAAQGGSTITQQLARQSFLTNEKTIRRKVQELIVARRIERMYSKPRILELYLNKIYFGDGLHGVEAASRGYFGKRASQLSIAEGALIAGLVKSPSSYAPTVSLERARARRNVVLNAMLETGVIDRAAWQAARSSAVLLHDNLREDEAHGQYFKEQVRLELVERFGWQRVYQGGLRVFSTIDMSMQQAAEVAVTSGLQALDARRKPVDDLPLQAALLAMDPASGHVRAMIGGRDFAASHFNRAVQAERQPGSAFKPFVYAAALEAGFTPATIISNLNEPIETPQGGWTPEDEHSTADEMSLRTGLRTSSNRAAVRLLQEVGIEQTVHYASNLGVENMPSVPSLALGSGEVTLQSLTAAYAAFANGGLVPRPLIIRRVEDKSGRVLYAAEDSSRRAISATTAFLMATMMADVINAGTGARARQLGFTLPAAGKTGTTNGFRDAWFVGFTPTLVAGVWVGFDQPRTILRNGFAADVAVPLWASFMKAATKGDKPGWLTPPPRITTATVCRLSGKLATKGCEDVEVISEKGAAERRSMVYTEYFVEGTQPSSYCALHPSRGFFGTIVSAFGGGGQSAPPPNIEDTGVLPATATVAGVPPSVPASTEASEKKRGFWSRLFGGGKDRESRPEEPQPQRR
jgi:1A family penicillin-binding protein